MVLFYFSPVAMTSMMSSISSPMKMMSTILIVIWFSSISILMKGVSQMYSIFLIMLFNGGLMILYLFLLSMIPKEKETSLMSFPMKFIITMIILKNMSISPKQEVKNMYFNNVWLIIFSMMTMTIMFMYISSMMNDFFKTMKSQM